MILLAISAAVAAQTPVAPPPPPPPPPPIVSVPSADPLARYIKASAPLADLPGWTADFLVDGDDAAIRVRRGGDRRIYRLDTVSAVLEMLADRRLEGLWPAIVEWGGPGMTGLRDRRIARARAMVAQGGTRRAQEITASTTRPKIRAAIALANELAAAGRLDEAVVTLQAARGATPGRKEWDQVEWSALTVRLSGVTLRRDGVDAAVAVLESGAQQLGTANPYSINMDITRAAILAQAGRFAAALPVIVQAEQAFRAQAGGRNFKGEKVSGSDRQFAWIRACVLHGLARPTEAAAAEAVLAVAADPKDHDFVTESNTSLRYRYARCRRDVPVATRELATDFRERLAGGGIFLVVQPGLDIGRASDPAFAQRLRAAPEVTATLGPRLRILPAEFVPALNNWEPPRAVASPAAP